MAAMAVKDESLHHAVDNLILPKPRKYYQALIQNNHWQLRSLLSSPEQHIVYYPGGNEGKDIIALNTKTRERETIFAVDFEPRCLAASKHWLCVGGEHGNYIAIFVGDRWTRCTATTNQNADPDDRLMLDLDSFRRSNTRETTSVRRPFGGNNVTYAANATKLGAEIVNSITIWSPPQGSTSDRVYKTSVSVVSNNDCTVLIINLEKSEVLQHLRFPDFVNRSVMSPDGELLATISDDPFLYIHSRRQVATPDRSDYGSSPPTRYEWGLSCRIQLEGQRPADKTQMRGSFAACFSKSGKYLAVATQYGIISIFDTECITEPRSLITIFTTSRPSSERDCGAVRAMEFCPAPFDLLAWTESTGRAGVADVRNLFLSRQLVMIDHSESNVEIVNVTERRREDRVGEPIIDPRLRSFRSGSPSSNTATDYLGLDAERRQLRYLTREMLDRQQAPLTTEELEVLQAHRVARRQREAANATREALAEASSLSRWSSNSNSERISPAGLPPVLREFVNPERTAGSFRSFINERNQDRERRSQAQQDARRRRNSLVLAAAERSLEQENQGSNSASERNTPSSVLARLRLTDSRASENESLNNPWAEIDALYRSRFPDDVPTERQRRLSVEAGDSTGVADDDRRDFAQRLRQPWRFDDTSHITFANRTESSAILRSALRPGNIETMGCCWSEDGKILYIGAENGIHEYHVNVSGRKFFPSIVLR